jgi:methionyl-tRNA formyltransferase
MMKLALAVSVIASNACASARPVSDEEMAQQCGVGVKAIQAARVAAERLPRGSVNKFAADCFYVKGDDGMIYLATMQRPGQRPK